jgi:hypothetical protein
MSSINAKLTAKEVSETIRAGKPVVLGKIIRKRYSNSTSKSPQRVTQTKSYQEEIKPITEGLYREINRLKNEMESRDLSIEEYKTLSEVLDKTVKNYQLLSDKPTDITKNNEIESLRIQLNDWIKSK